MIFRFDRKSPNPETVSFSCTIHFTQTFTDLKMAAQVPQTFKDRRNPNEHM